MLYFHSIEGNGKEQILMWHVGIVTYLAADILRVSECVTDPRLLSVSIHKPCDHFSLFSVRVKRVHLDHKDLKGNEAQRFACIKQLLPST